MGGRVSGPQYRLTRLRGKWAVAVYQDGHRTERLTLGTGDRKEAERLLARFIADRDRPREITVTYLWQRYGIPVRNYTDDTMLMHHALQPESEKGLGFLGSVYCDEPAWKQMRKHGTTIKKEE